MDIDSVRHDMLESHKRGKNWRAIGVEFGVTGAMAFRIAERNYEPKEPHIRHTLGLPVIIPTPACPKCGEVHAIDGVCVAQSLVTITVVEMTAEEYAKVDKPVTIKITRRPRKDSRPRATINVADPASAARTIRRKMDAQTLELLINLLRNTEQKGE